MGFIGNLQAIGCLQLRMALAWVHREENRPPEITRKFRCAFL